LVSGFDNEAQRFRIRIVAWLSTNLASKK
jgi:hypothetical protein